MNKNIGKPINKIIPDDNLNLNPNPNPDINTYTVHHDPVNHPSHYTSGKYETIDVIHDFLDDAGFRGFCLGNVAKYLLRAGKKDRNKEKEDLQKAQWYLNKFLKELPDNGTKN